MTAPTSIARINYISNKELLLEIDRSKFTYCSFIGSKPTTTSYDVIVHDRSIITPEFLDTTLEKRNITLSKQNIPVIPSRDQLTIRLMDDSHVPDDPLRRRRTRSSDSQVSKTPFAPFRHYNIVDGIWKEIARSHWKGDFIDGDFCVDHGKISNRLAYMFMLLVERYSKRGNWRGYTYVDEMRNHALLQLSQIGLQFDESKSDNPFSFYTQVIKNCCEKNAVLLCKEYGVVKIGEISGQDVHLLDGNKEWVLSHIYNYGIQETVNIVFFNGSQKIQIATTWEHSWIEKNTKKEITTRQLIENYKEEKTSYIIEDLLGGNGWMLYSEQQFETKMEEVFCPIVPTTNSFALASGIHSHNCFTRILNVEKKNQHIRDDLLIIAGIQPSFTRQTENEMEQQGDSTNNEVSKIESPKKRGRKPKSSA